MLRSFSPLRSFSMLRSFGLLRGWAAGTSTGGSVVPPPVVVSPTTRYSSLDLVQMCKEKAARPDVDAQMDDTAWLRLLTEAQDMLLPEIADRAPDALAGQYATLTTVDGGRSYQFGTDVYGEPVIPFGHVEVWAKDGGRELFAASYSPRAGDFVIDGPNVRMPGGTPRTFPAGPFARWIGVPPAITSTQQPIIFPRPMRVVLVFYALVLWAERGARRDPTPWRQGFRREWMGDAEMGLLGWCAHLQLRFKTQNSPAAGRNDVVWWQNLNG